MTDLTLKFKFTDRSGAAVYDVFQPITSGLPDGLHVGQVRIPPDPRVAELESRAEAAEHNFGVQLDATRELEAKLEWLDNNTTFYHPDESDGPVLASVSKRIWYHATDDVESYPFTALLEKENE